MYKKKALYKTEITHVVENLCEATRKEINLLFPNDKDNKVLISSLEKTKVNVIHLKETDEPVGLFGLVELDEKKEVAGIYLLTTDNLHKGNIITFLKEARKQIKEWSKEYKLIMDSLFKENQTIKKWLKLLGFKPSELDDGMFQTYYIGDISLYE